MSVCRQLQLARGKQFSLGVIEEQSPSEEAADAAQDRERRQGLSGASTRHGAAGQVQPWILTRLPRHGSSRWITIGAWRCKTG